MLLKRMTDEYFMPEMGTGKQVYYNQVQLEQINDMSGKKKGGKIIVQEVDAGFWWGPLAAELLAPIVKKVVGSGACGSEKQMEKKFRKELKAAGFFTDMAKNLAKKAFEGFKSFAAEKGKELVQKAADTAIQKGTEFASQKAKELIDKGSVLAQDKANEALTKLGKGGRRKKGGVMPAVHIGGCSDCGGSCSGGSCVGGTCEAGTRKTRGAMVKKRMKSTGKSLPEVSAEIKKEGAYKSRKARNELVRAIMKEKSLSLPAASKYVKENGLKY